MLKQLESIKEVKIIVIYCVVSWLGWTVKEILMLVDRHIKSYIDTYIWHWLDAVENTYILHVYIVCIR